MVIIFLGEFISDICRASTDPQPAQYYMLVGAALIIVAAAKMLCAKDAHVLVGTFLNDI
eukprot:SAG31_NODE_826_length_11751_cov_4.887659_10_plen_59_part_00